eukprot:gene17791-biopygen5129
MYRNSQGESVWSLLELTVEQSVPSSKIFLRHSESHSEAGASEQQIQPWRPSLTTDMSASREGRPMFRGN